MGQIFGIFAKSKGELIIETPLKAEEESYYSLANIFLDAQNYVQKVLANVDIEQERKDWLMISLKENDSLKYNNIQDFADDEINYRKSVSESLPVGFHAIGMIYVENKGEIVYSPKYKELENWSKVNVIYEALYKIKEVLYEDLKKNIELKKDSDPVRYSYENIQILLGTITTLKKIKDIDEVALVYGPY